MLLKGDNGKGLMPSPESSSWTLATDIEAGVSFKLAETSRSTDVVQSLCLVYKKCLMHFELNWEDPSGTSLLTANYELFQSRIIRVFNGVGAEIA